MPREVLPVPDAPVILPLQDASVQDQILDPLVTLDLPIIDVPVLPTMMPPTISVPLIPVVSRILPAPVRKPVSIASTNLQICPPVLMHR